MKKKCHQVLFLSELKGRIWGTVFSVNLFQVESCLCALLGERIAELALSHLSQ